MQSAMISPLLYQSKTRYINPSPRTRPVPIASMSFSITFSSKKATPRFPIRAQNPKVRTTEIGEILAHKKAKLKNLTLNLAKISLADV